MYKIYPFFLIIFSSCFAKVNYLGNSYSPTKEPDFFVDERSIDRPYKIMGKGYPRGFGSLVLESLQKRAIEKAKAKGADAVLVQDYFIYGGIGSINSVYHTDSLGGTIATRSDLAHGSSADPEFVILFLKYTDH